MPVSSLGPSLLQVKLLPAGDWPNERIPCDRWFYFYYFVAIEHDLRVDEIVRGTAVR